LKWRLAISNWQLAINNLLINEAVNNLQAQFSQLPVARSQLPEASRQ